jgi:hypothetical protein
MMTRNNLLAPRLVVNARPQMNAGVLPQGANAFNPTVMNNAPMPGAKQGWTPLETQNFINNSVRVAGFINALAAGSITPVQIDLSGTAKLLLGFCLHSKTNFNADNLTPRAVQLTINNEAMIQNAPFNLLDIKYIDGQFYEFVRPLSGNDSIELIYDNTGQGAQTVEALFYFR